VFHILAKEQHQHHNDQHLGIEYRASIDEKYTELAVRVLHEAFDWENDPTEDR